MPFCKLQSCSCLQALVLTKNVSSRIWHLNFFSFIVSERCLDHKCTRDPCQGAFCANYPRATCIADYCGGCNAHFYLYGRRV